MAEINTDSAAVKTYATARAKTAVWQGLAFDVAAALAIVLWGVFDAAQSWGDFEWTVLAFLLLKTAVVAALSYLMRTVLGKGIPSAPVARGLAAAQSGQAPLPYDEGGPYEGPNP